MASYTVRNILLMDISKGCQTWSPTMSLQSGPSRDFFLRPGKWELFQHWRDNVPQAIPQCLAMATTRYFKICCYYGGTYIMMMVGAGPGVRFKLAYIVVEGAVGPLKT